MLLLLLLLLSSFLAFGLYSTNPFTHSLLLIVVGCCGPHSSYSLDGAKELLNRFIFDERHLLLLTMAKNHNDNNDDDDDGQDADDMNDYSGGGGDGRYNDDDDDDDADRLKVVGDFKCGSITCIKLKNFLTYSDAEINPGPYVRFVLGERALYTILGPHTHTHTHPSHFYIYCAFFILSLSRSQCIIFSY